MIQYRNCDKCGEPGIVGGACYDCAKLCPECDGPMPPKSSICDNCIIDRDKEERYDN